MPDDSTPQKPNLNKLRNQLQQAVDANATLSQSTIKVLREQLEILTGTRSARASTVDGLSMQLDQTEKALKETKALLSTTQDDLAHEKTRVVNSIKMGESQAATINTLKSELSEWQSKYEGKAQMMDNALDRKQALIERLCSMEAEDAILTVIRGGVCKTMKKIVDDHTAAKQDGESESKDE